MGIGWAARTGADVVGGAARGAEQLARSAAAPASERRAEAREAARVLSRGRMANLDRAEHIE